MDIEKEIFKKANFDFKKLKEYGFDKSENIYSYRKDILDGRFRVSVFIDDKNVVSGKVVDNETDEEYTNFRVDGAQGSFASTIREEYKNILMDIKEKCCQMSCFIYAQSNRLTDYILKKYGNSPEFLWKKFSGYGVFRNSDNNKWYAIIMNIDFSKIDDKNGEIEVVNLKLSEDRVSSLINSKGFYKSYHMNSKNWITVLLDDTVDDDVLFCLLDESYSNVKTTR